MSRHNTGWVYQDGSRATERCKKAKKRFQTGSRKGSVRDYIIYPELSGRCILCGAIKVNDATHKVKVRS